MQRRRGSVWLVQTISLYFLIPVSSVQAQITSDGTLSTKVDSSDNRNFTITDGNRVGDNLFHSFREFSIPTNGSVLFSNTLDIQNIITRVTGGSISDIDGILKANGTANLFLLNPNGIIFGANASLNIGGSFVATTASSIKFSDHTEFSTTNPSTSSVLTVSVPVGLQFGTSVGRIINRSRTNLDGVTSITGNPLGLQVQSGKTLALVGGEVLLEGGNLTAPNGRIELGSVAGNSFVKLEPTNQGLAMNYEGVQNFQDIHLSQKATIDVSPVFDLDLHPLVDPDQIGSGDIQVQGRQVRLIEGSQISSITFGAASAGTIEVIGSESIELSGTSADTPASTNFNTFTIGNGNAGDLRITTKRLIIQDGAGISTSSLLSPFSSSVQGRSGNLTVTAAESIEISGSSPTVGQSELTVATGTAGNAGNLQITTPRLIIRDGGRISAATSGTGQGGTIMINAPDSVDISGTGIDRDGKVTPSTLVASSRGTGNAGNLTINTNKLTLRDGGEITATSTESGGGDININAEDIRLRGGSLISTSVFDSIGGGGNITINSDTFVALEDSDILANAFDGRGGNITIISPAFVADIFRKGEATAVGRNPGEFGRFRGNDRVDISVEAFGNSNSATSGNLTLSSRNLDQNSLMPLSNNFISVEEAIADSCLTHRNKQQGSFTVTGTGGLPHTPYDLMNGRYALTEVQGLSGEASIIDHQQQKPTTPQPGSGENNSSRPTQSLNGRNTPSFNSWKPGDPILEAQGMTRTPDGRIIVGTAPELTAAVKADNLVCYFQTQGTGNRQQQGIGTRQENLPDTPI